MITAFRLFNEVSNEGFAKDHIGYDAFSQQSVWVGQATPFADTCTVTTGNPPGSTFTKCSSSGYGCSMSGNANNVTIRINCDV